MTYPSALYTDHYQLTMALAEWRADREFREGSMEFFCRSMPATRRYLVFAGLHRIIELLRNFSLDGEVASYMREHATMGPAYKQWSAFAKWAGEQKFEDLVVTSMKEGEIFFPNEPVLRISGRVILLQIIETAVLSILNHDVMVASKAARISDVAEGKKLFEFGMRRTGLFDAPFAASAAMAAGFQATSCVAAGYKLGLPTVGTMAHSYIQSYDCDGEFHAFCNFLITMRYGSTLLVDTYDIATGTMNAIFASRATKVPLTGVRLDSGDPRETVPMVRALLDAHGCQATEIIVSNDMDEYKIAALPKEVLAQINGFGVGTQVVNPSDCTSLGFVGKLVQTGSYAAAEDSVKLSADPAKTTWPAKKQVQRSFKLDPDTKMYHMAGDVIGTDTEFGTSYTTSYYNKSDINVGKEHQKTEGTTRLLDVVSVKNDKNANFNITEVAQRFRANQLQLPPQLRSIAKREPGEEYPVEFSKNLQNRREDAVRKVQASITKAKERYKL